MCTQSNNNFIISDGKKFYLSGINKDKYEKYIKDKKSLKLKDFNDVVKNTDVSALAAASIYHFTNTTPRDVKIYLNSEKIPVRNN